MGSRPSKPVNPPPFSLTSYFNFPPHLYTSTSSSLPSLLTSSLSHLSSFQSLLISLPSPSSSLLLTSRVRELDHVHLPPSVLLEYQLQDAQAMATWAGAVVVTPLTYAMSGSVRSDCAHEAVQLHTRWMAVKFLTVERILQARHQHVLYVDPSLPTPPLLTAPKASHQSLTLRFPSSAPLCEFPAVLPPGEAHRWPRGGGDETATSGRLPSSHLSQRRRAVGGEAPPPRAAARGLGGHRPQLPRLGLAAARLPPHIRSVQAGGAGAAAEGNPHGCSQSVPSIHRSSFLIHCARIADAALLCTAAAEQSWQWWAEPVSDEEFVQPWRFVHEQLQQRLHRHRLKLLGVGLTWKDRNLSGALEWEEAEDIDAELFAVLSAHQERGRSGAAVRPQDAVMAAVTWALSLFQAHSELEQLQEENNELRIHLNRVECPHTHSTLAMLPLTALLTAALSTLPRQAVDDDVWELRWTKEELEEEVHQLNQQVSEAVTVFSRPLSQAIRSAYHHMPQLRSVASAVAALECLRFQHEQLLQLDPLQPPPEETLRHELSVSHHTPTSTSPTHPLHYRPSLLSPRLHGRPVLFCPDDRQLALGNEEWQSSDEWTAEEDEDTGDIVEGGAVVEQPSSHAGLLESSYDQQTETQGEGLPVPAILPLTA